MKRGAYIKALAISMMMMQAGYTQSFGNITRFKDDTIELLAGPGEFKNVLLTRHARSIALPLEIRNIDRDTVLVRIDGKDYWISVDLIVRDRSPRTSVAPTEPTTKPLGNSGVGNR